MRTGLPRTPIVIRKSHFRFRTPAQYFLTYLKKVGSRADLARAITDRIDGDNKSADLLAKIATAVAKGDLKPEEIREFISGLPVIVQKSTSLEFIRQIELPIAPGWKVVEVRGMLVDVVEEN